MRYLATLINQVRDHDPRLANRLWMEIVYTTRVERDVCRDLVAQNEALRVERDSLYALVNKTPQIASQSDNAKLPPTRERSRRTGMNSRKVTGTGKPLLSDLKKRIGAA